LSTLEFSYFLLNTTLSSNDPSRPEGYYDGLDSREAYAFILMPKC